MTAQAQIIGNAFRLTDMTPGWEAAIGRAMLAAVRRERKRPETPRNGYRPPLFADGAYDVARATVLRLLADGPMYSSDMIESVPLARQQFMGLLGAMRLEAVITCVRPDNNKAALWSLP